LLLHTSYLPLGVPNGLVNHHAQGRLLHIHITVSNHHAVTTVLGTGVVADDLGQHRQNTTKSQGMEEPEGLGLPLEHMTTKTMKNRWAHHALLAEFAPHQYPKVSNYPMISKNMMDPMSHHHGSKIIYRQSEYSEDQRKQQCKVYKSTSPAQLGHG
jgi:hypothetical protein